MATEDQINANRRNAQKSTGPRTAEGKAISRMAALKHGLSASEIPVLPGENVDDFERLSMELEENLGPVGALEEELVEYLAQQLWRLRRVYRLETSVFAWYIERLYLEDAKGRRLAAIMTDSQRVDQATNAHRPENVKPTIVPNPVSPDDAEAEELFTTFFEPRYDAFTYLGRAFVTDS